MGELRVIDLGRMAYREAYEIQLAHVEEVLEARAAGTPDPGRILVVEHDPVVTVSRRKAAPGHVLATEEAMAKAGVALEPTDRGGDVTYHGPGQLVVYPILDLNHVGIRLHEYMRVLEQSVIDALAGWGIEGTRDPEATGVWVGADAGHVGGAGPEGMATQRGAHGTPSAGPGKIAAMGVRVKKWVSMHGLSLNVDPDLSHFQLIVPCGLAGRPVTSVARVMGVMGDGETGVSMGEAREAVVGALSRLLTTSKE